MNIRFFALILALTFVTPCFSTLHWKDIKNGVMKVFCFHPQKEEQSALPPKQDTISISEIRPFFESLAENEEFYIVICDSTVKREQLVTGVWTGSGFINEEECKYEESNENSRTNEEVWKNIIQNKNLDWNKFVKIIKPLKTKIEEPPRNTNQATEHVANSGVLVHPLNLIWKQNKHKIGLMPDAKSSTRANILIVVIEPSENQSSENSYKYTPIAALVDVSIDNLKEKVPLIPEGEIRYSSTETEALIEESHKRREEMLEDMKKRREIKKKQKKSTPPSNPGSIPENCPVFF